MITLNTERGLVKVDSWQEIEEIPGFTKDIDPKEYELNEIIGRYIFKNFIRCGLSACHTPHGKGYIVTTKTGPVTNIGRDCGRKHFGIEFETLSSRLEQEIRDKTYRDSIGSFLILLEGYKKSLAELRAGEFGADSVYKKSHKLTRKSSGCPQEAITIISKAIRSRNPEISTFREASKKEIDDLEAIQGRKLSRPYYIEEKVGAVAGISFLYKENDLRDRLVVDLENGFRSIEELDVDTATSRELKHWSLWSSEVERKLDEAKDILASGKALIDKENLLQIGKAIEDFDSIKKFRSFVENNM